MNVMPLLVLLLTPAQAGISLFWGPTIDQALVGVDGRGREVVRGFDGMVLKGLEVRLNEVEALDQQGVRDLDALKRYCLGPKASSAGISRERLEALERTLTLLAPVITRLEARGARVDDQANSSIDLGPQLSQALAEEAAETERRAGRLADRFDGPNAPAQKLEDYEQIYSLLNDRYFFLSDDTLGRLARLYDAGKANLLAERRAQEEAVAFVTASDRATMRDAVSGKPPKSLPGYKTKAAPRKASARP